MASKIYSPNSRLTKLRRACNLNTNFYARSSKWNGTPFVGIKPFFDADDLGYMYYDTDSNTSAGFVFVTRYDYSPQVQNFKQVCFSSCLRLFRIRAKTVHPSLQLITWTYYRVDATGLLHGNNTGRTEEEVSRK